MQTSSNIAARILKRQAGFTILELMIATMVFSVILLVVAAGILSFTNQYIKGITSSNTQAVTRSIMADVAQTVQFSNGQVSPLDGATTPPHYCVGSTAYYVSIGQKVTAGQHGLVKDTGSCDAGGIDLTLPTQHEMLDKNMRVAEFAIKQVGSNSAQVTITVVAGDFDTFTDGTGNKLTSETLPPSGPFVWSTVHCKSGAGTQFCDVSRLTTFVQGRIQ